MPFFGANCGMKDTNNYLDMAWQLGFNTLEMVNRMNNREFKELGEEMLRTAKQVSCGEQLGTQTEMYDAYTRCLRLMSYLQAVEDMGIITAAEYKDYEIQILAITRRLQQMYKAFSHKIDGDPSQAQC